MKNLRSVHLYLGCFYAPMLILFAITGLYQTIPLDHYIHLPFLSQLSSIHTGQHYKAYRAGNSWTSIYMRYLIVTMTLSLVFTIILGIIMAWKFGHRRAVLLCVCGGIAVPALFVLMALR